MCINKGAAEDQEGMPDIDISDLRIVLARIERGQSFEEALEVSIDEVFFEVCFMLLSSQNTTGLFDVESPLVSEEAVYQLLKFLQASTTRSDPDSSSLR